MLYFIPAWYQLDKWCENEQIWYRRRTHSEFDDTVKQMQLFHRKKAYLYQILLLGHAPNFRHFLHRQGLHRAPYWSCFDAIQAVRRKQAAVLSFRQFKWPDDVEFIYTPFVVCAMLGKERYAQIEFGEDGNLIWVDIYEEGKVSRRDLYDDRGFLSATVLYENGQPVHQDYLMENGVWKLRHFYVDGHVEVNPEYPEYLLQYRDEEYEKRFSGLVYDDMEQVIREVFLSYLCLTQKEDIFCVAMHDRHTDMLAEALKEKKLIMSFFSGRSLDIHRPQVRMMAAHADYIVADSGNLLKRLRKKIGISGKNSVAIPPYDCRVDSGFSLQFNVQKILVAVDGIEEEWFGKLVCLLGAYLQKNKKARIHLLTRMTNYDRKQRLLGQVREALLEAGMKEGWAEEESGKVSENDLAAEEHVPIKFFVEQCVDELSVNKCMRGQRLFVDLREVPELYPQITAISIGIPQIVRTKTEFVVDGQNGRILKEISLLPEALHYYLDGLKNWNSARVYSYELMKEYTTDKLLKKWREVMDSVAGDMYFTIGERKLE